MALSAQEQAELAQLEKEMGSRAGLTISPNVSKGLSPQEQAEMQALEKDVGHLAPPAKNYGYGQTALEHGANAAALGYLPQLQAAAQPYMFKALNALTGQNVEPDSYLSARDQNVKRLQDEQEQNPKTALASQIGGGVVGAMATPIPGMGAAKGILGAAGKGAAIGGGYGLLSNPGDVEGEINPVQLTERLANAKRGLVIGGVTGGAAHAVAKGLRAAGPYLKDLAENQAVKASGGMLKDFRALNGRDQTNELGRFALDNGLVGLGDTVDSVAEKAATRNETAGKALDKLYSDATSAVEAKNPPSPDSLTGYIAPNEKFAVTRGNVTELMDELPKKYSQRLKNKVAVDVVPTIHEPANGVPHWPDQQDSVLSLPVGGKTFQEGFNPVRDKASILSSTAQALGNSEGKESALKRLSNYLDQLAEDHGNRVFSPRESQDVKTAMDQVINYERNPLRGSPVAEQAFSSGRNQVANKIEQQVGELAPELQSANKDYGFTKKISAMAGDRVNRESAHRILGLTDTIAGGAGAAAGGMANVAMGGDAKHSLGAGAGGFLAAALLNKLGRKYGPSTIASGANALSNVDPVARPIGGVIGSEALTRALIEKGLLSNEKKQKTLPLDIKTAQ